MTSLALIYPPPHLNESPPPPQKKRGVTGAPYTTLAVIAKTCMKLFKFLFRGEKGSKAPRPCLNRAKTAAKTWKCSHNSIHIHLYVNDPCNNGKKTLATPKYSLKLKNKTGSLLGWNSVAWCKERFSFLKRNQPDIDPLKAVNFFVIHSSTTKLCSQNDPACKFQSWKCFINLLDK